MENTTKIKDLYQAIETNHNSFEKEAKVWFYRSEDECLRSVCFEYMSHFEALDDETVLKALQSDEFGLVCLALEEVDFNSGDNVKEEIVKIAYESEDSFLAAWALFHYTYIGLREFKQFERLKFKWRTSTIVKVAFAFQDAVIKFDYESILGLLKYLRNPDYEVRSLCIRSSEYFIGTAYEALVVSNLKAQERDEELPFLKEQIKDLVTLNT